MKEVVNELRLVTSGRKKISYFEILVLFQKSTYLLSIVINKKLLAEFEQQLRESNVDLSEVMYNWDLGYQRAVQDIEQVILHGNLLPIYSFYKNPSMMTSVEQLYFGLVHGVKINGLGIGFQNFDGLRELSFSLTDHDNAHLFGIETNIASTFPMYALKVNRLLAYVDYTQYLHKQAAQRLSPEQHQRLVEIFVLVVHEAEGRNIMDIQGYKDLLLEQNWRLNLLAPDIEGVYRDAKTYMDSRLPKTHSR